VKVLQLSYSRSGGAGAVARNLSSSLNELGVKSDFEFILSRDLWSEPLLSVGSTIGAATDEYIVKKTKFSNPISIYREKFDSGHEVEYADYDLVNLHWTPGFIRLKKIDEIIRSGIPVVWTLHDMWAFTSVCHFSGDCMNFKTGCIKCPAVRSGFQSPVASFFEEKLKFFGGLSDNLSFVAPSSWLGLMAKESKLIGSKRIDVIANPVPEPELSNYSKERVRERLGIPRDNFVIAFIAANLDDRRKGLDPVIRSIDSVVAQFLSRGITLLLIGKGQIRSSGNYQVINAGYMSSSELYNSIAASDISINFSSEENLSMAIIESLAVGTPVIGTDSGGNSEIIDNNSNGFLVQSPEELARKIRELLENPLALAEFSTAAITSYRSKFTEKGVARQYLDLYLERTN